MAKKLKIKSRPAVEAMVRRFFGDTSEDYISLDSAFKNWGRKIEEEEKNKQWLSNKLPHMKYYNLITPVYAYRNNRRILDRLQLTLEGKRLLGRIAEPGVIETTATTNGKITLEDIMKAIPRLQKENPEFNIVFSVSPKDRQ